MFEGARDPNGYGRVNNRGGVGLAHRAAWIQVHGSIPTGMFICHRCDNPGCVNVEHLFIGTAQDNTDDMMQKGRQQDYSLRTRNTKTRCINGHEYTEDNTIHRASGLKACHMCKRQQDRQYYLDNKLKVQ